MRLFAAFLAAGISMSGTAYGSSIIVVEGDGTSPSSVLVDAPKSAGRSIVDVGVPSIDTGKVAAIDASAKISNAKAGGELMVIRGGDVGSASPEPAAMAPAQQAAAGDQAPLPNDSTAPVEETVSAEPQ